MKRVLTAAILIPVVLVVLFRAPFWTFAAVVLLVALLAGREYLQLAKASNLAPLVTATLVLLFVYVVARSAIGVHLQWGPWQYAETWATTIYKLSPLLLLVMATFTRDVNRVLASSGSSFLTLPYIGMTLSELMDVRHRNGGALLIFFFFLTIWVGDVSAYYVGKQFGKHRLAPAISPNKSWEGTAASFVGSLFVAILLFRFVEPISNALVRARLLDSQTVLGVDAGFHTAVPWVSVVMFAAVTNIAAQVGDLVESALKRGAGVKDSGTLLPGHGGVLDRIDALLLAIPVLWYYAIFLARNHLWFLP